MLPKDKYFYAKFMSAPTITTALINAYNVSERYEQSNFGYSLVVYIYIMYFHYNGIRSRVEQGARDFSKFESGTFNTLFSFFTQPKTALLL